MATKVTPEPIEDQERALQPAPMIAQLSKYTNLGPSEIEPIAKMMVAAKYFTDVSDVAGAYVKILAGQEMGIAPFAAMSGIAIIKGRPSIGANLMAAQVKSSPKYDYRVKTQTAELCEIEFFQEGKSIGTSSFSIAEARKAGTQNLDRFARNMLFARAMSNGVKWYTPDVFMSGPVYTAEELGYDNTDLDGAAIVPEKPFEEADVVAPPKPRTQTIQEAIGELMTMIKDHADVDISRGDIVKVLFHVANVKNLVDIKGSMIPTLKAAVNMLDTDTIITILKPAEAPDVIITSDDDLTAVNLDDIPF